jgi:hypothetical protein
MAADPGLFRLELLPDAVVARRRFMRGTVWAIAAGVVLCAALGLDFYAAGRGLERAKAARSSLEACLNGDADAGRPGLRKQLEAYKQKSAEVDLLDRRARMVFSRAQRNVPVLGFVRLLRQATPPGITLSRFAAAAPEGGGREAAGRIEVTVTGAASRELLKEDEFTALDKYRQVLLERSRQLAFGIDEPKIRTSDVTGSLGREFTLTARIFTLGVDSEEEESVGPAESGDGTVLPVPIPVPVTPRSDDGGPDVTPVIIPRGIQSRPRPPGAFVPDPGAAPDEGGGQ